MLDAHGPDVVAGTRPGGADPSRIRSTEDLARELTLLRRAAGLTIRALARQTGLLPSTLGGYFSGRHRPPLDALERVLAACGVEDGAREPWRRAALALRRPGRRPDCPYPGLAAFQPEDARRFHGRAALARTVLAAVDAGGGPVVLVGASGSGKSSLLRAGVVAALREREDTDAVVVTPGGAPLTTITGVLDAVDPARRAVLAVDQCEELFAPDVPAAERAAVLHALAAAPVAVVLGLRADFYAHALAHPVLADALARRQVVVGPLGPAELREVITAPAAAAGTPVEDALVDLLVDDAQRHGSAGALPLLAHALRATWLGGAMTVAAYRATGGVEGAVAASAEEAVHALGPERLDEVRRLFLRLVTVAPDAVDTRHAAARDELPVTDDVIDAFLARRLITVDAGGVQITHEALIGAWPRLRAWLDADREGALVRRRTAEAARAWRVAGEDPDLLLRGARLLAARDAAADGDRTDLEAAFLAAGRMREDEQRAERRRRTRRLRRLVAALAVLVLLTGGLATVGAVQAGQIAEARDVAVSRQVAVRADALRGDDPALAAQLALAAYRIAPTTEARSSLLNATAAPLPARMPGFAELVGSVAVAGEVLASASDDRVQVWTIAAGVPRPAGPPLVAAGPVTAVALAPDGAALAVGTADGATVHDLADPGRPGPATPAPASGAVAGLAFGPAGLVVAGADGVTVAGAPLPGAPAPAGAVAASATGAVAAADGAGGVVLWPAPGAGPVPLAGPAGRVPALAFTSDGAQLLGGSTDRLVHRWPVAAPDRPLPPLAGPTNWINAVAVSPDGATVAVGSSDGSARLFDAATGAETAAFPHPAPVVVTAFTDGATLVTAGADGTGRRWAVHGPVLTGFGDAVFALAFDRVGERIAIGPGSKDGTARLWTADAAPRPLGPGVANPDGEPTFSGSAALTPDGRTLAVGRSDGSVRLWDATDAAAPLPLGEPLAATGQLVEQLTTSPDGRRLAASGDDATVRLWDITDPAAPVAQAPLTGAGSFVFASSFSPDGSLLAAASADARTYLWDVRDPAAPRLLTALEGPDSFAYSAAFTPDGRTLAVGSADRTVRLWDVSVPERPVGLGPPLTGPANYVYSVAFSPDGRALAAASTDGTVWTWDTADVRAPRVSAVLTGPTDAVFSVAWSPDGRRLAAGSADRTVRLWTTGPDAAASAVCAGAGAVVDADEWARYVPDLPYAPPC